MDEDRVGKPTTAYRDLPSGYRGWIGYHRLPSVTIAYHGLPSGYRRLLWVTDRLPWGYRNLPDGYRATRPES
jgi:hypothetical protein